MTDKEIIKALECCLDCKCKECPYFEKDLQRCKRGEVDAEVVLALIKRQQAEIERLQEIANPKCQQCVEQTRKNGIVEFAGELKHRILYWTYDFQYNSEVIAAEREVDDLVKELTEASNGE